MIKQQQVEQTNKLTALRNVLRNYRWTPHTTTRIPPTEALFQHPIRTELAKLKPISTNCKKTQTKFNIGQMVWAMNLKQNKRSEWKPGVIKNNIGSMLYEVNLIDRQTWKRHQNQLRLRHEPCDQLLELEPLPDDLLNRNKEPIRVKPPEQQSSRYPRRNRKPPERYTPS